MSARFAPGDRVRIAGRDPTVHNRVPRYARGHVGVIERVCGAFGQPELLAYGGDGEPYQTLYRVRLEQTDLWPDYAESPQDTLEIEIFEHWLDPA
ncbi:MAG: nitrile hydratase subunit beta [Proteobacteria bacterium]|nr:nitrile hydratase subunit beta [Pseudomonadota bacterium]